MCVHVQGGGVLIFMCAGAFSKGTLFRCNDIVDGLAAIHPQFEPITPTLRAECPLLK